MEGGERRHMRLTSATQVDHYAECHDLAHADVAAVRDMARELRYLRTVVDGFTNEIRFGDPDPERTAAHARMRELVEGHRRALLVQCRDCDAPPGYPCTINGHDRSTPHQVRVEVGKVYDGG